jgi:hypothetical protein
MDILEYIKQMQEMYGEDVITTADKLEKPPKTVVREMFQNAFKDNKADGGRAGYNDGQLVTPSIDESRPGYKGPEKFPIPKGYITANQLAEELGISKETLKKYRTKSATVDKYPLKGFINETFKPFKGKSSVTGTATYYLKPTEKMLENYQNFKNRTIISRDLLNDVEKLHKSKLFKDLVKSKNKSLPTLQEVVKVLGKETKAHHRAANAVSVLAKMYQGDEYKLLKLPKNEETGKFIFKALRQGGKNNPYKQAYYQLAIEEIDKTLGNETGTLKNFKRYFKDNLTKYLGKGHGVSLNEVASISGMVSNDMAPYGAFVDLTNTKINNDLLAGFQGDLSKALTKIDGLKGKEKLLAIKQFNEETLPKFKKRISDQYGKKLANSIRFTEIVPGTKIQSKHYAKEDLLTWKKKHSIDLKALAKKKGYYLDVKGARPYTEFLENKKLTKAGKINAMETLIKSLCPKGKASGGRIGYQDAGAVTGTLQCGLNQFNKNLKTGNANSSLMRRILANGGNILKSAGKQLNPAELLRLRNLIGPQALGFFAAYEAGDITDDILRKNIPVNEALAKNWLTKTFLPYREQGARAKNLLQSGKLTTDAQKKYALDLMKLDQAIIKQEQVEQMKLDQGLGYGKDESGITNEMIDAAEKDLERRVNAIGDPVFTEGSAIGQEYQTLEDEMIASRLDKFKLPFQSDKGTRLVNKLARPGLPRTRGPMTAKREMKVDFSLPTYDRMPTPTDQDILNAYRRYGDISPTEFKTGVLQPGEGTLIRMMQGGKGLYGSQFASGGLASLTDTIPPESGPMSQGLRSLYNNDMDY